MPFTFAHPAIVLPFKYIPRKWISMTALITGSIMPDAEAYLLMFSEKDHTHSWSGFFLYGLPLGLLLSFLYHNLVRNPLINNLPGFLYQRFAGFESFNWNRRLTKDWLVVVISMIAGGASHFLWDSFSHFDGWFINQFPFLKGNVYLGDQALEIPFLLQYINSFVGVAIIVIFIALLPQARKTKQSRNLLAFWISVLVLATAIFFIRRILIPRNGLDDLLIAIVSAFLYSLFFVATFYREKRTDNAR